MSVKALPAGASGRRRGAAVVRAPADRGGGRDPRLPLLAGQRAHLPGLAAHRARADRRRLRGRPVPAGSALGLAGRAGPRAARGGRAVRAARRQPLGALRAGDAAGRGPAGVPLPGAAEPGGRRRRRRDGRRRARRLGGVSGRRAVPEAAAGTPGCSPSGPGSPGGVRPCPCAVAALLAVQTALHGGPATAGIVVCALCCGLWLAFLLVAHRRIRALRRRAAHRRSPRGTRRRRASCVVAMAVGRVLRRRCSRRLGGRVLEVGLSRRSDERRPQPGVRGTAVARTGGRAEPMAASRTVECGCLGRRPTSRHLTLRRRAAGLRTPRQHRKCPMATHAAVRTRRSLSDVMHPHGLTRW